MKVKKMGEREEDDGKIKLKKKKKDPSGVCMCVRT